MAMFCRQTHDARPWKAGRCCFLGVTHTTKRLRVKTQAACAVNNSAGNLSSVGGPQASSTAAATIFGVRAWRSRHCRRRCRPLIDPCPGAVMQRKSWFASPRRMSSSHARPVSFRPSLDVLEDRLAPAVTSSFNPTSHTLVVRGDNLNNNIVIARTATGFVLVNGARVATPSGFLKVAAAKTTFVNALAGNDAVIMNITTGTAPRVTLVGGAGNDTLVGGPGADILNGGDGNDLLDAAGGADQVFGGAGDDTLIENSAVGGADFFDPGAGSDIIQINGAAGDDNILISGSAGSVSAQGAAMNLAINLPEATDRLTVNGLAGNDTISAGGLLENLIQLALDGGDGNDTLNGGNGADTLIGGDGNDTIDGNGGNDTVFMGNGNDTAIWDPGDGSDIIEGQAGTDTLQFNGAPGAEIFAASSNGGRLLFTRNVGNIVMDCNGIEILTLNMLGGIDTATINDLAATDVTNVNLDLGVNGTGDNSADAVTIIGTVGVDVMSVSGSGGSVTVAAPAVTIALTNAETANDTLTINTSTGDDIVSASALANSSVKTLTLNGGADNDILVGSQGDDTINGDDGDDLMFGGPGVDTFTGGTGTD